MSIIPDVSTPEDDLTGNWLCGGSIDAATLRNTAGAFPSGVTIITASAGSTPVGLTISSFASVSLDPPLLLVCVARTAGSLPAFRAGGPMAVNILANDQAWLAKRFASRHDDRFASVDYTLGPHGVPLLDGVSAWMDCHIARIYDGGDHVILLTRVHSVHRSDSMPLLYHSGAMYDWEQAATENTT
ncbi:flavin reductase family protein [Rhodococcus sp. HNM0569]|uniref:flavin reductase family protein n=1 Tax=Rhodococcus sp. HNM0569 TaxID=2716340 RepID=UPI00146F7877|nr:flavin reductase family protein [Rhodococcus sp. HNM0569]NLU82514.1 flavin reductase family protein [Rhodococcus sp. HNM0569]